MELTEITSFMPLLEIHGLSRWWFYKQWHHMRSYKYLRTEEGKKHTLVPHEEMLAKILIASKRKNIATLLSRSWNVLVGKRMTYLVSRSHGTWQRHYGTPRAHARMVISTPADILALKPRFYFFSDGLEHLIPVLAREDARKIQNFLVNIEKDAKQVIHSQCKNSTIQEKISLINYEEFYMLILDKILYGETPEKALEYSLSEAPKYYDYSSSFEIQMSKPDFIENIFYTPPTCSQEFKIDLKKLEKQFFHILLNERVQNSNLSKQAHIKARKEAGVDMAIFILHLQHATDEEICARIHFKGTRQRLTQRRQKILDKARPLFAILRE